MSALQIGGGNVINKTLSAAGSVIASFAGLVLLIVVFVSLVSGSLGQGAKAGHAVVTYTLAAGGVLLSYGDDLKPAVDAGKKAGESADKTPAVKSAKP